MNARFDAAVWSGVERRLAGVEGFIPDAPPWTQPADSVINDGVRPGSAFRRVGARSISHRRRLVLALTVAAAVLALIALALLVGAPTNQVDRRDEPFGPFGIHRSSDSGGSAAVLPDGRVLIASGSWEQMGTVVGPRIDIWDPVRGRVDAGAFVVGRVHAAATLLLDGRVLVTGGFGGPYAYSSSAVATAEVWDPGTGAFEATGSMRVPRVNHTATLLRDGRVLVIGGTGPGGSVTSAEIWDPATGVFRDAGDFTGSGGFHTAALLPSGDVLVLGTGLGELWRVATERFSNLQGTPSIIGSTTVTMLLDGRLFVIRDGVAFITADGLSTTPAGSLPGPRGRYATTLLPDGRVLISGGVEAEQGPAMTSVLMFDPVYRSFRAAPPLAHPVDRHMALLLPDGRVLIVFDVNGPDGQASPFIYDPGSAGTTR